MLQPALIELFIHHTVISLEEPKEQPTDRVMNKQFDQGGLQQLPVDNTFKRLDTNGDGYLSPSEAVPYFPAGFDFDTHDLDANGGLDGFELSVLRENQ